VISDVANSFAIFQKYLEKGIFFPPNSLFEEKKLLKKNSLKKNEKNHVHQNSPQLHTT